MISTKDLVCTILPLLLTGANSCIGDKVSDLGIAIARRELCRISNRSSEKHQVMAHLDSIEEQSRLLETTITVMKMLDSHPRLVESAQPTLWHTDLHMGNIFVSPDDNTQITSLIDVQCQSILPLFLQAQWPVFLQPPREYIRGFVQPSLPDDFESLDEDGKAVAMQEWAQSKVAKAYEVSKFIEDRAAYNAMDVPRVFRELFIRAGEVSEAGAVPLRECLIDIFQNWSDLRFPGQCPYSFSHEEISNHERQFAQYREWNEVRQLAQECLDTDAEGWIAPQLDFAEKRRQNRELLSMYIEQVAGEKSPEEARRIWPFPE